MLTNTDIARKTDVFLPVITTRSEWVPAGATSYSPEGDILFDVSLTHFLKLEYGPVGTGTVVGAVGAVVGTLVPVTADGLGGRGGGVLEVMMIN